jgi:hypothetical protein
LLTLFGPVGTMQNMRARPMVLLEAARRPAEAVPAWRRALP